jgi:hypothetical protein
MTIENYLCWGALIFFVGFGLWVIYNHIESYILSPRTTRHIMTEQEAAAEYQRLYDQEYDHNMRGTVTAMEQIVAQQGWDRASHMPGPHPVINGAVGENKLDVIRWRSLWGLGPRDGGNPKYNPKT